MSSNSNFSGKSGLYGQFRASYPPDSLAYLADEVGLSGLSLADIGCGTGLFTLAAADFAARILAVDPNADMLASCARAAEGRAHIELSSGRAEASGLPDHCVEAVVAAQAFHFFDPEAFKRECLRILKPGGRVILMWNSLPEGPLADRLGDLSGPKFKRGLLAGGPEMVAGFYPGDNYQLRIFPNNQSMTREAFIGRYLASSYAPKEGEERYADYIEALSRIFDEFQQDGLLDHPYQTIIYVGGL